MNRQATNRSQDNRTPSQQVIRSYKATSNFSTGSSVEIKTKPNMAVVRFTLKSTFFGFSAVPHKRLEDSVL